MTTTKEKKTREEERTNVDASFLKSCQMSVLIKRKTRVLFEKVGRREEDKKKEGDKGHEVGLFKGYRGGSIEQNRTAWDGKMGLQGGHPFFLFLLLLLIL